MTSRSLGLDALRCCAILLVLGRHIDVPADAPAWLVLWQRGGWIGVDLFFVLSGFLISGLLFTERQRTGSLSLRRFYARRWFRIYPPFAFLIVVSSVVGLAHGAPIADRAFAELLFVQNYFGGLWHHTWSLAVEEHFYLLLPPILILLTQTRFGLTAVPWLVLAIAAICLVLRIINWQLRPEYSHLTHIYPTHLRADSLLMGVGVSYAYHFHREALNRFAGLHRQALIYFGVICFLPAFIWTLETSAFLNTIGLTWFSIGASAILLGTLHVTDGVETLWLRFAAHLGSGSYSVYLWHMLVAAALTPLMQGLPLLIWVGLYTATSFAVGLLMARLIEQPALAARNRLFPPVQSVASASSLTVRAL